MLAQCGASSSAADLAEGATEATKPAVVSIPEEIGAHPWLTAELVGGTDIVAGTAVGLVKPEVDAVAVAAGLPGVADVPAGAAVRLVGERIRTFSIATASRPGADLAAIRIRPTDAGTPRATEATIVRIAQNARTCPVAASFADIG